MSPGAVEMLEWVATEVVVLLAGLFVVWAVGGCRR